MRRFWRSSPDDDELRESGTRVPAVLVDLQRTGDGAGRRYRMSWEAQSPEGATIPFTVEASWAPVVGTYLEAACDEARERATLILDLGRMSETHDRVSPELEASAAVAAALRNGSILSESRRSMIEYQSQALRQR